MCRCEVRVVTQLLMIDHCPSSCSLPATGAMRHQCTICNTTTTTAASSTRHPHLHSHPMRFPSFPQFVRAFHTISNTTSAFLRANPAGTLGRTFYSSPQRVTIQRSMPNIPFLGALFGSSSKMADNTNYAVSKPEGEWQAQLSPGIAFPPKSHVQDTRLTTAQSSSASFVRKALKRQAPAS